MRGRLDRTGVIVLLAGMLVAAPGASADTVTIEPLKDVTLIETPDGSLANGFRGLEVIVSRTET